MGEIAGMRRTFVKAAMDAPFLTREDEHALAVRWKDLRDEDALHQLATAHMRLVIAIAARFRTSTTTASTGPDPAARQSCATASSRWASRPSSVSRAPSFA